MNAKELLEKDRERLLSRLSAAENAGQAVTALEEEISRVLYQLNETKDERAAAGALGLFRTAKAAASLADGTGEIKVYDRLKEEGEKKESYWAGFLFLALAAGAAGSWLLILSQAESAPAFLPAAGIVLVLAGLVFAFLSGKKSMKGKRPSVRSGDLRLEARPDAERLYRHLSLVMNEIDRSMEETAQQERAQSEQDGEGELSPEEAELFAGILELVYASETDEEKEIASAVRYYLHRKGIEMSDYTPEHDAWFDHMPGTETVTVRPALLKGSTLAAKGLVAGRGEK